MVWILQILAMLALSALTLFGCQQSGASVKDVNDLVHTVVTAPAQNELTSQQAKLAALQNEYTSKEIAAKVAIMQSDPGQAVLGQVWTSEQMVITSTNDVKIQQMLAAAGKAKSDYLLYAKQNKVSMDQVEQNSQNIINKAVADAQMSIIWSYVWGGASLLFAIIAGVVAIKFASGFTQAIVLRSSGGRVRIEHNTGPIYDTARLLGLTKRPAITGTEDTRYGRFDLSVINTDTGHTDFPRSGPTGEQILILESSTQMAKKALEAKARVAKDLSGAIWWYRVERFFATLRGKGQDSVALPVQLTALQQGDTDYASIIDASSRAAAAFAMLGRGQSSTENKMEE